MFYVNANNTTSTCLKQKPFGGCKECKREKHALNIMSMFYFHQLTTTFKTSFYTHFKA